MKQNGFTLLEILVSVSALAIMEVLLTQVFVTTIRTNTRNEIAKEVKQNGDLVLGVMTRLIQNAQDVTSECLPYGSTAPSLTITNPDAGSTRFECLSDSGVFRIASTSGTPSYLTSTDVTLTGGDCGSALKITCTLLASNKKSVNILFTLAQKSASPSLSDQAKEKFETTVSLRNQ